MLPQVPIIRVTDSQKVPMPSYTDGIGTCMILRSNEMKSIKIAPKSYDTFSTGFAIALPIGMEAQIRSLKESTENGIIVLNAPATIDASDRKEIRVCVYNASSESVIIKQGDPIAMMVFSMALRVQWTDPLQKGRTVSESQSTFAPKKQTVPPPAIDVPNAIRPVPYPDVSEQAEADIPDEVSPADEVVAPPAILEEFEKIENNFEETAPEGNN
ncbi:MAG: hypothetical protein J6P93_05815 [Alphaproteobacteria bacterium]|nr:hypothetical protein [Alphaproteobacteria bacterium]